MNWMAAADELEKIAITRWQREAAKEWMEGAEYDSSGRKIVHESAQYKDPTVSRHKETGPQLKRLRAATQKSERVPLAPLPGRKSETAKARAKRLAQRERAHQLRERVARRTGRIKKKQKLKRLPERVSQVSNVAERPLPTLKPFVAAGNSPRGPGATVPRYAGAFKAVYPTIRGGEMGVSAYPHRTGWGAGQRAPRAFGFKPEQGQPTFPQRTSMETSGPWSGAGIPTSQESESKALRSYGRQTGTSRKATDLGKWLDFPSYKGQVRTDVPIKRDVATGKSSKGTPKSERPHARAEIRTPTSKLPGSKETLNLNDPLVQARALRDPKFKAQLEKGVQVRRQEIPRSARRKIHAQMKAKAEAKGEKFVPPTRAAIRESAPGRPKAPAFKLMVGGVQTPPRDKWMGAHPPLSKQMDKAQSWLSTKRHGRRRIGDVHEGNVLGYDAWGNPRRAPMVVDVGANPARKGSYTRQAGTTPPTKRPITPPSGGKKRLVLQSAMEKILKGGTTKGAKPHTPTLGGTLGKIFRRLR